MQLLLKKYKSDVYHISCNIHNFHFCGKSNNYFIPVRYTDYDNDIRGKKCSGITVTQIWKLTHLSPIIKFEIAHASIVDLLNATSDPYMSLRFHRSCVAPLLNTVPRIHTPLPYICKKPMSSIFFFLTFYFIFYFKR